MIRNANIALGSVTLSGNVARRDCLRALGALLFVGERAANASRRVRPRDVEFATARELSAGLRAGHWSAKELTRYYLARIEAANGPFGQFLPNDSLNAFVRIYTDEAERAAERADARSLYGEWSGIPVALKDVFDVAGCPVTVGTSAFASYRAAADCTLWSKWRRQGAVLLGHTQAQRFITGLTTPQTANPWNQKLIAGGSSGGSAAAVAAGMVPIALGTDTTGSLIYPAACCAITALKPSHGLLSLAGVYPGLTSFDVAGPLARSVDDCAWALGTLCGIDPADPATLQQKDHELHQIASRQAFCERPLAGLRFLVAADERYSDPSLRRGSDDPGPEVPIDPRMQRCFDAFLKSLEELGAKLVLAPIPNAIGRFGTFRGMKRLQWGNRSAQELLAASDYITTSIPAQYRRLSNASDAQWAEAVRWFGGRDRRIESDELLALASLVNPLTLQGAALAREELRTAWDVLLAQHRCDAHVYLEIGSPLPKRAGIEDTQPPHACRNGVVPSDLGWPVLSLPVGSVPGLDVPVSAQIMARRWHDHRLLQWGIAWQRAHPELTAVVPGDAA